MKKITFRFKAMALATLALLFLSISATRLVFAENQAVEYLCEIGKSFYNQGKTDDALAEFNNVLAIDPDNQTAKAYINKIFAQQNPAPEVAPQVKLNTIETPISELSVDANQTSETTAAAPVTVNIPVNTAADTLTNEAEKDNALAKEEAMESALNGQATEHRISQLPSYEVPDDSAAKTVSGSPIKVGPLKVTGSMQLAFGVTPKEFVWKRADFNLNEKSFSWRMYSDAGLNNRFNTFDPQIYDSLVVNLDTENKQGFNFHTNITVDPWSFTGTSSKTMLTNFDGDSAEVQLKYWSNSGYTINQNVYGTRYGNTFNIPGLKVKNGETPQTYVPSGDNPSFTIPGMKIERQFQPVRELWMDYTNDQIKLRVFPFAYQNQAYTSDDPLNITNHGIWWKDSKWLRNYVPGTFHLEDGSWPPVAPNFTKGRWDDSLSFLSKDSTGQYLTTLRGFSFSFMPDEATSFDTTFATPKNLWQNYGQMDNVINATRLKHAFADNLAAGATFTSRTGFITDPDQKLDSQNFVAGADIAYEFMPGFKADAEVLTSQSYYDMSNSTYKTDGNGNAYYFSFITRYPQKSIIDTKYGYDGIKLDKDESFLVKSKFYLSRMDTNFDSSLSDYHNTRQDVFWGRHIHFRKPMDYYSQGLEKDQTKWDELNATRIGDGIDAGRNTIGFRLESFMEEKFYNLFDFRNVHNVNGKFIENVVRDEATVSINEKLTAKILGLYQKLPHVGHFNSGMVHILRVLPGPFVIITSVIQVNLHIT